MVIFSAIIHSVDWGILTMGKKIKKQSSPSEMSEVAKGISMILQIGIEYDSAGWLVLIFRV